MLGAENRPNRTKAGPIGPILWRGDCLNDKLDTADLECRDYLMVGVIVKLFESLAAILLLEISRREH